MPRGKAAIPLDLPRPAGLSAAVRSRSRSASPTLRDAILKRLLPGDSPLPSSRTLAARWGVARGLSKRRTTGCAPRATSPARKGRGRGYARWCRTAICARRRNRATPTFPIRRTPAPARTTEAPRRNKACARACRSSHGLPIPACCRCSNGRRRSGPACLPRPRTTSGHAGARRRKPARRNRRVPAGIPRHPVRRRRHLHHDRHPPFDRPRRAHAARARLDGADGGPRLCVGVADLHDRGRDRDRRAGRSGRHRHGIAGPLSRCARGVRDARPSGAARRDDVGVAPARTARLGAAHRAWIIEDDYDGEFSYQTARCPR